MKHGEIDAPEADSNESLPSAPPIRWILAGALCLGALGACYGAYLHFHPERKEEMIRQALSEPHMDNYAFLASRQAIRHMSLWEIAGRKALTPALAGAVVGCVAGVVVRALKRPAADATRGKPARFGWTEFLLIALVNLLLAALLFDAGNGSGLVYYEGRHQFHWCEQLEHGEGPERTRAVAAAIALLEGKPFVCRSRMIAALGKCGDDAAPAIAVLEQLAHDRESNVREAAVGALAKLGSNEP